MKPANAVAGLVLLSSPVVAQATIEREVTIYRSAEEVATIPEPRVVGAGTNDEVFPGRTEFDATSSLYGLSGPSLPGVEIVRVESSADFAAHYRFDLLATHPGGTILRVDSDGGWSYCGGTDAWGAVCGENMYFTLGPNSQPFAVGTTEQVSATGPQGGQWSDSFSIAPWNGMSNGPWVPFLNEPHLTTRVVFDSPRVTIYEEDGVTPTTAVISNAEARAFLDLEFTQTFELAEAQTIPTCTSPANSTGQHGTLRAYGSLRGGNAWLTIQSSRLPVQQACLLFMGSAPDFQPFATYNLCIGGSLTREGGVQFTDLGGRADHEIDLTPYPPGTVLYAQVVHREPTFLIGATDAIAFVVE